ncbi:MAG: hypothetical protein GYA36_19935 [Veillonellaceae bacterium]|nr:hypothetical protein [Veillonellaceae bacterium]
MMTNRQLLSLLIPLVIIVFSGCGSPPPEAPCQIDELLLKESDLPGNNIFVSETPSIKGAPMRLGVERIGVAFGAPELFDGANHQIYRMVDEDAAFKAYQDVEEEDFSTKDYLEEWNLIPELSQIKTSASSQRMGCNLLIYTKAKECRLLALYGPYLVRFSIRLHDLQYTDVTPLIQEIDSRMTECLLPK